MSKSDVGRPPKDPEDRLSYAVRTLVTPSVGRALAADCKRLGLGEVDPDKGEEVPVEYIRLLLHWRLSTSHSGEFLNNPELRNDPTWDKLKVRGLV
jgi:hypothetical protein